MIQIKEAQELVGKTIVRTAYTENKFFLFFENHFAIFSGCGYGDYDVELSDEDYDITPSKYNIYHLFQAGFVSEDEYNSKRAFYERQNKRQERGKEIKLLHELKTKYPKV